MIRVVLIDDHAVVRTGFRQILEKQSDISILGEATDGESGLLLIREQRPDIALVDVHMPGVSGLQVTEYVRKSALPTRIIIFTVMDGTPFPKRFFEAGASGYLTKACPADELLRAVRQVALGKRYLSPDVAQRLALEQLSGNGEGSLFDTLTSRELEVAMMLAQGHELSYMAERLNLSSKTVGTYKSRLYEKLNVDNPVSLARLAALHGLLDPRSAGVGDTV